jgi:hypothetical protein
VEDKIHVNKGSVDFTGIFGIFFLFIQLHNQKKERVGAAEGCLASALGVEALEDANGHVAPAIPDPLDEALHEVP